MVGKALMILISWGITLFISQEFNFEVMFPFASFPMKNFFLGFLGNFAFSIAIIFRSISAQAVEEDSKPFNRYMWILVTTRPFGAAAFNFILAPLVAIIASLINEDFESIIVSDGGSIAIGLFVGFFFEYLIRKSFLDGVFDRFKKKTIGSNGK